MWTVCYKNNKKVSIIWLFHKTCWKLPNVTRTQHSRERCVMTTHCCRVIVVGSLLSFCWKGNHKTEVIGLLLASTVKLTRDEYAVTWSWHPTFTPLLVWWGGGVKPPHLPNIYKLRVILSLWKWVPQNLLTFLLTLHFPSLTYCKLLWNHNKSSLELRLSP